MMKEYWEAHSQDGSVREMMLDDNAEAFSDKERREILSLIPSVARKDILELGAGIGRFTGDLAEKAKSILAVDFIEKFIIANQKTHGRHRNARFIQADATQLELPENSVDLVFSNWLMMYLSNDDTENLFKNVLSWLREDGYFFFRESCFHQSGNKKRGFNPSKYRCPSEYNRIIDSKSLHADDGSFCWKFEIVSMQSVKTYIEVKGNCTQICWLLRKVRKDAGLSEAEPSTNGHSFDVRQWLCGQHYAVTGGNDITELLVPKLNLQPKSSVLDYGTGLGGAAFYMAKEFDCSVRGVGPSSNALVHSIKAADAAMETRVAFEVQTDGMFTCEENSIDGVLCRDYYNYVKDKAALLRIFERAVKPGKRIVISDICLCDDQDADDIDTENSGIGPYLSYKEDYRQIFESSGLKTLHIDDLTDSYLRYLKQEYNRLTFEVNEFTRLFSLEEYQRLQDEWQKKIHLFENGQLRWLVMVTEKETGVASNKH